MRETEFWDDEYGALTPIYEGPKSATAPTPPVKELVVPAVPQEFDLDAPGDVSVTQPSADLRRFHRCPNCQMEFED
jgi:hypothetical protein